MSRKKYFKYVPDFEYVSRLPGAKAISDYVQTKNLFKRVKLSDEIFEDLTFFTKYKIENDDRPDSVAYKVYEDSNLDWLVMLSNNIINLLMKYPLQSETILSHSCINYIILY